MRLVFCDHCGKDITKSPKNEIGTDDCFTVRDEDGEIWFVGYGCELCDDCWDERIRLHAELDKIFLNLEMIKDGKENQPE